MSVDLDGDVAALVRFSQIENPLGRAVFSLAYFREALELVKILDHFILCGREIVALDRKSVV